MSLHRVLVIVVLALVACGCGRSRKQRECEKLADRVVDVSASITEGLYELDPDSDPPDRSTLEEQMHRQLDEGDFMDECMKLSREEVHCLSSSKTQEEWEACGWDEVALP